MNKILGLILTPFFCLFYALTLLLFHPVQVLTNRFSGDGARRRAVDVMNAILVKALYLMGSRVKFVGLENIPNDRPVIIVANHQSLFDIPAVGYAFAKLYPKFISKIELGKNLPSISYNLKQGQSALIDRENGSQSVKEIFKLGRLIEANNYAACIFPEGTRSKNGNVRKFQAAGINTLLRAAPSAVIVPFVIDGHNRLMTNGKLPLVFGQKITYTALAPVDPKNLNVDDVVSRVEEAIINALNPDKA